MSDNEYEVVVRLPRADRFHFTDDRHLAGYVADRVRDLIGKPGEVQWNSAVNVEVRKAASNG